MTRESVKLEQVRKSFGGNVVIDDLSIAIEPGEFLVVLGPSGCGKTTLLNLIAGLDDVDGGRIYIGGRDVSGWDPKRRNVAMVFQSLALYPTMTAAQNIAFALKVAGLPAARVRARVGEVANLLRIEHLLDRRPDKLSGGERQRVAIGRALVRDPAVMLLDEPLTNLDSGLRSDLRAELKRLHRLNSHTTLYVTHDQIEAMTLGNRIAVLDKGRILQCDTPQAVYQRPSNVTVAGLLGTPAMRFFSGRLGISDNGPCLRCNGDALLPLPGVCGLALDGRPVLVGLRPDDVELVPADAIGALKGPVRSIDFTGVDAFLSVELACGEVVVRAPSKLLGTGVAEAYVRLDATRASVFCPRTGDRLN